MNTMTTLSYKTNVKITKYTLMTALFFAICSTGHASCTTYEAPLGHNTSNECIKLSKHRDEQRYDKPITKHYTTQQAPAQECPETVRSYSQSCNTQLIPNNQPQLMAGSTGPKETKKYRRYARNLLKCSAQISDGKTCALDINTRLNLEAARRESILATLIKEDDEAGEELSFKKHRWIAAEIAKKIKFDTNILNSIETKGLYLPYPASRGRASNRLNVAQYQQSVSSSYDELLQKDNTDRKDPVSLTRKYVVLHKRKLMLEYLNFVNKHALDVSWTDIANALDMRENDGPSKEAGELSKVTAIALLNLYDMTMCHLRRFATQFYHNSSNDRNYLRIYGIYVKRQVINLRLGEVPGEAPQPVEIAHDVTDAYDTGWIEKQVNSYPDTMSLTPIVTDILANSVNEELKKIVRNAFPYHGVSAYNVEFVNALISGCYERGWNGVGKMLAREKMRSVGKTRRSIPGKR